MKRVIVSESALFARTNSITRERIITCGTLIYTIDHPDYIVCSLINGKFHWSEKGPKKILHLGHIVLTEVIKHINSNLFVILYFLFFMIYYEVCYFSLLFLLLL